MYCQCVDHIALTFCFAQTKREDLLNKLSIKYITMGGAMSIEVPGGGTEGYHVLRVSVIIYLHSIHAMSA